MILVFILVIAVFLAIALVVSFTRRDFEVLFAKENILRHNQTDRRYLLIGERDNIGDDSKLIIAIHGFTDTPKRFAYYTALHNTVGKNDIVVYPKAIEPESREVRPGWNSGFCCGSGWVQNADDSGYLAELAKYLQTDLGIPDGNVFVTGFSNGAFMALRVAIDHPDIFNGLAVSSGTIGTTEKRLEPKKPLPILLMHGRQDKTVNFDGGIGKSDPDLNWLPFEETLKTWQKVNDKHAITEFKVYEENAHEWNNWRLYNFWNKKPEASQRVNSFFDSL